MAKESLTDIVSRLALPIVEETGCELVDVEYVKEGRDWFLRVYIDKPGGVTLDDCEKVSRQLDKKIDEIDPVSHPFYLEVSSPGIERPLKKPRDFERAMGNPVEIRLFKPVDNRKRFEGELIFYDGKSLAIKDENNIEHKFMIEQIAKAKRVFKF
jgi:ribosome maturation factor RimP